MQAIVRFFAAAGIGAALSAPVGTSFAADAQISCSGLGHAQQRVLEHADQGIDALRRYVIITRPVHGISMVEVAESIDGWRAKAQCSVKAAANAPAGTDVTLAQSRQ